MVLYIYSIKYTYFLTKCHGVISVLKDSECVNGQIVQKENLISALVTDGSMTIPQPIWLIKNSSNITTSYF